MKFTHRFVIATERPVMINSVRNQMKNFLKNNYINYIINLKSPLITSSMPRYIGVRINHNV